MPFFDPKGEPLQNPYQLLNLEHGATDEEIAKSFKKLMLQLHPDKQPANQSATEKEEISRKFHNVMDAKSFLLDGEFLTARRGYDSRLVRVKQQQQQQKAQMMASTMPSQPSQEAAVAAAASVADYNPMPCASKEHGIFDAAAVRPDYRPNLTKTKHASFAKNKNGNVKQWGKVNRPKSSRPLAYRRASVDGNGRRASVDGDNDPSIMKNKAHARAKAKAFNDSCGDCSTTSATDECTTSDDESKRRHTYSSTASAYNTRPSSNRPSVSKSRHKVPKSKCATNINTGNIHNRHHHCPSSSNKVRPAPERTKSDFGPERTKSDFGPERATSDFGMNEKRREEVEGRRSSDSNIPQPKPGYRPVDASKSADYSRFFPIVDLLEKKYHCPLTGEVMKEPMSDFEGNSYERNAIFKYLETNNVSPITGSPLYAIQLSTNSALREKIRYTLKLKDCLDTLQKAKQLPPSSPKPQAREVKCKSLREAVDNFIKDLNSGSPAITMKQLDSCTRSTSFSYLGIKFQLQVPEGVNDNIIVQTWFEHSKKAAGISARIVQFNAALHKMGLGGKLTYRCMNGKYAFTLTKKIDTEKFSNKLMRHSIEYFMEMSIKLHNVVSNTDDIRKGGKVRLTNCVSENV